MGGRTGKGPMAGATGGKKSTPNANVPNKPFSINFTVSDDGFVGSADYKKAVSKIAEKFPSTKKGSAKADFGDIHKVILSDIRKQRSSGGVGWTNTTDRMADAFSRKVGKLSSKNLVDTMFQIQLAKTKFYHSDRTYMFDAGKAYNVLIGVVHKELHKRNKYYG